MRRLRSCGSRLMCIHNGGWLLTIGLCQSSQYDERPKKRNFRFFNLPEESAKRNLVLCSFGEVRMLCIFYDSGRHMFFLSYVGGKLHEATSTWLCCQRSWQPIHTKAPCGYAVKGHGSPYTHIYSYAQCMPNPLIIYIYYFFFFEKLYII